MTVNSTQSSSSQQEIQAMWSADIKINFDAKMDLLNQMEDDVDAMENDLLIMNDKKSKKKEKKAAQRDYDEKKADYEKCAEELRTLDPSLSDMIDSTTEVVNAMDDVNNQKGKKSDKSEAIRDYGDDADVLFDAMASKVSANASQQELDENKDSMTDAEIKLLTGSMIQNVNESLMSLGTVNGMFAAQQVKWDEKANAAEEKKGKNRWLSWQLFTGVLLIVPHCISTSIAKDNANAAIEQAEKIMTALSFAMKTLIPALVQPNGTFVQLNIQMAEFKAQVQEILSDPKMSQSEKEVALLGTMMMALGFINLVKAQTQSEKTKYEALMGEGTLMATEANLKDVIVNQNVIKALLKSQEITKWVNLVNEIVLGAMFTIMAPGVGSALFSAAMTALSASGGIDKATAAMSESSGMPQWAADIIVVTAEVAASIAADKGMSAVSKQMAKQGTAVAEAMASKATQEAIETSVERSAGKLNAAGEKAAESLLTQSAKKAAEKAAEGATEAMMNESLPVLMKKLQAGTFQQSMKLAIEEAIESSIKNSDAVVRTTAERAALVPSSADEFIETGLKQLEPTIKRSADEAVASVMNHDLEKVAARSAKSEMRETAEVAGVVTMMGVGQTQFLTDLLADLTKDMENKDAKWVDNLELTLSIIQALMQAVSMMLVSGANNSSLTQISQNLQKILLVAQAGASSAQTATATQQIGIDLGLAKAEEGLSMTGSMAQLLESFSDQIRRNSDLWFQRFAKDLEQEMRKQSVMSGRLFDGEQAGIKAMMASSA